MIVFGFGCWFGFLIFWFWIWILHLDFGFESWIWILDFVMDFGWTFIWFLINGRRVWIMPGKG